MGQREDVQASLLRGDSRDELARRKVADRVREVVMEGASQVATEAYLTSKDATVPHQVATAASAVVLASDLRAPAETRAEFIERLASRADVTLTKFPLVPDEGRTRVEVRAPGSDQWQPVEGSVCEGTPESGFKFGPEWRARLASVERLLTEVDAGFVPGVSAPTWNRATAALVEAATEIRAMLGGGE